MIQILSTVRSSATDYNKIYNRAVSIASKIDVLPQKPRTVGRQRHRANAGDDTTVFEHYRLNHFLPFVDHVVQHLMLRFPEELNDVLLGMYLLPGHFEQLNDDIIEKIKATYLNDLPMQTQLDSEVMRWKHKFINSSWSNPMGLQEGLALCNASYFPNINSIFQLILTLPVGSFSCERSF